MLGQEIWERKRVFIPPADSKLQYSDLIRDSKSPGGELPLHRMDSLLDFKEERSLKLPSKIGGVWFNILDTAVEVKSWGLDPPVLALPAK